MKDKIIVEYVPIKDIVPYARNPRDNKSAVQYVKASIKEFGFKNPVILDRKNEIVAGHTRILAAKELGMVEVPCIRADDLTEEQVRAFRIADNKVSEVSTWDETLLDLELLDIGIDMSQFGFEGDIDLNAEKTVEREKTVRSMELKAFEHHDYIVFVFENQMDWLNAVHEFGLERVDAGYGKTRKIGIGRVINGKRLLEKVGHPGGDSEQGQS